MRTARSQCQAIGIKQLLVPTIHQFKVCRLLFRRFISNIYQSKYCAQIETTNIAVFLNLVNVTYSFELKNFTVK